MNVRSIFLTFIMLLNVLVEISSQQVIEFSSSVNEVLVGQPFDVNLSISYPQDKKYVSLSFENILHSKNTLFSKDTVNFEANADIELIKNKDWPDFSLHKEFKLNLDPESSSSKISNTFTFAIYNPGIFILPSPMVEGQTNDAPTLTIQVIVPPFDSLSQLKENDIYPIKTIEKEPSNWSDYQFLLFGLILLLLLYYFWKKSKNSKPKLLPDQQESLIQSPADLALEKIAMLEIALSIEEPDLPAFHEKISFIIREFLENQKLIRALELSSSETIEQFENLEIAHPEGIEKLKRILNYSDLVKFAKSLSQRELAFILVGDAKWFVINTDLK